MCRLEYKEVLHAATPHPAGSIRFSLAVSMTTPPSSLHDGQRVFEARLGELAATAAFVHEFFERHALDPAVGLRVTLILEELVTNTVTHGHGGDSEAPIRIALSLGGGTVSLLYEDNAPRFDPQPHLRTAPASLEAPLEPRPTGGLGLYLVGQFVTRVRYAHEDGCNRLWLAVPLP